MNTVLAQGLERIHRAKLIGIGVLPLQFKPGEDRGSLRLDGSECHDIEGLAGDVEPGMDVACTVHRAAGSRVRFTLTARLDTRREVEYRRHGGMLPFGLRAMLDRSN